MGFGCFINGCQRDHYLCYCYCVGGFVIESKIQADLSGDGPLGGSDYGMVDVVSH